MHQHSHSHEQDHRAWLFYGLGLLSFALGFLFTQAAVVFFSLSVLLAGYHVIAEGILETIHHSLEEKRFVPNIHLLMTLAAIGAIVIGQFEEAALLILIFAGAHFLEEYTEGKSKKELTHLMTLNPKQARKVSGQKIESVPVEVLQLNDIVQVLPGEQIPIDGKILRGESNINEASINGESVPKEKGPGDVVYGSTLNQGEALEIQVTAVYSETVFAKIIQVVEQSQKTLSKKASKIKQLEPKYVRAVLYLVPVFYIIGYVVFGWSASESAYRTMIFLIGSSPCALAVSVVPATLAGISFLAKRGVLVKGGDVLANLSEIKAIGFDKTGTLTTGQLRVSDEVLFDAHADLGILYAMENQTNHPLAQALVAYLSEKELTIPTIKVTQSIGNGIIGTIGADTYHAGKPSLFDVSAEIQHQTNQLRQSGKTVIYFMKNHSLQAIFAFEDQINPQTIAMLRYFKQHQIHTTMITGDADLTAQAISQKIGIEDVQSEVLPTEKADVVQALKGDYHKVAMVGDGINDAPALVKADVAIAMGEGTDVAMEVADLVLMNNQLEQLTIAHQTAKRVDQISWQNIWFAMAVVVTLLVLNILGIATITSSVFLHEGSTLLVLVNSLRLLIPKKRL